MKIYPKKFLPPCIVLILLFYRFIDLLFWVNVGWDQPLTISQYSDSVSWWLQNIIKRLYLHKTKNNYNIFLSFCRVLIPLSHRAFDINLSVNIGWYMLIYILHYLYSVSWWRQNSSTIDAVKKNGEFPQYFFPIL